MFGAPYPAPVCFCKCGHAEHIGKKCSRCCCRESERAHAKEQSDSEKHTYYGAPLERLVSGER